MNTLDVIRVARDAEQEGRHDVAAAVLADAAPDFEYRGRSAKRSVWFYSVGVERPEANRTLYACDGALMVPIATSLGIDRRLNDPGWLAWARPVSASDLGAWEAFATRAFIPEPDHTWRLEELRRLSDGCKLDIEATRRALISHDPAEPRD